MLTNHHGDRQLTVYETYWPDGNADNAMIGKGKSVCVALLSEGEEIKKNLALTANQKKKLQGHLKIAENSHKLNEMIAAFEKKSIPKSDFITLSEEINAYSNKLEDFKASPVWKHAATIHEKIHGIFRKQIEDYSSEVQRKILVDGTQKFLAARYRSDLSADVINQLTNDLAVSNQMVDFFANYINERNKKLNVGSKVIVFGSWFIKALAGPDLTSSDDSPTADYPKIQELLKKYKEKKKNLFVDCDKVFFIANQMGAHWVLMIMDNTDKTIGVADSITDNPSALPRLTRIMNKLRREFMKEEGDFYKEKPILVPPQEGTLACGIHVCKNIELFVKNQRVDKNSYTSKDMMPYRKELLNTFAHMKLSENKEIPLPFDKMI